MQPLSLSSLLELSENAKKEVTKISYQRPLLKQLLTHQDRTMLGLCGPRGAGKTVLLHQALTVLPDSMYISVDQLEPDADIFSLIKTVRESYGFTTFFLDEVHFNKNIDQHLKRVFDALQVKLFFTSSVALAMDRTAHDLSRRVKLLPTPYFSFKEFLEVKKEEPLPFLSIEEVFNEPARAAYRTKDRFLTEYLQGGILPFALEVKDWQTALKNTLSRILYQDLVRVHALTLEEVQTIEKTVRFIGLSAIDDVNPSSISKNLGITRYKAELYLSLLEKAFVVKRVPPKGTNVLREPKIVLQPPFRLLYNEYESCIGGLREDFAVFALMNAGLELCYLKNSRGKKMPDYFFSHKRKEYIIEIGGAKKGDAQFRKIEAELSEGSIGIVLKDGPPYDSQRIPLVMIGFIDALG